ncbi:MAG: EamA family transporter, partial [Ferruginibacter sp.]
MKRAYIQLHIAVFLAGFTAILGKLIGLNEGLLVWYRLLITVIVLAIFMYLKKELTRIPLRDILKITAVGLVISLHWVTFYGSVKYANVSVALVCFSSIGFFTALFEPLLLSTRFRPVELLLGLLV